jgi:hypothetical protein
MDLAVHTAKLTLLVGMLCSTALSEPSANQTNKAEQWRKAAINCEWAAVTQEGQAWGRVKQSEALKTRGYRDEADRLRNLAAQGATLQNAGDLQMQAARSFDRAAANWNRAARSRERGAGNAKASETQSAAANTENAANAIQHAATHYEQAAEIFRNAGPSGAARAASLHMKAAGCREALASR